MAVSARPDTSEPVRLLNYLTAPNVLVWSAVACSSAFPFLFAPQTLLARDSRGHIAPFANKSAGESQRRWRDGSLESDLPMRGLSEMFNVNYFLVSQCNPYLLPVIAAKEALPRPFGIAVGDGVQAQVPAADGDHAEEDVTAAQAAQPAVGR